MDSIYIQISREIEELTEIIEQIRSEIKKYLKMGNVFSGPSGIRGIDYSSDKVHVSGMMAFSDAIKKIEKSEYILQTYLTKLIALKKLKAMFDRLYKNNCDTLPAKVFYFRFVKKYTQKQTASELGYSERQIQRIERKIKYIEKNGDDNV